MTKRTSYTIAAALMLGIASSYVSHAEEATFKIGGIVAFSGAYGIIGESMRRGSELAVEQRGGKVLGKPVEFLWEDDETKPQIAMQKGAHMLASHVQMLYGAISSSSTLALMKLAEQRKVPIIVTASADDRITGVDKNRYTFRTSHNSSAENLSVFEHLKNAGVKKLYGIAADYNVMREGWALLRNKATAAGVEIMGEDFVPLGNKDYAITIDKVSNSGAEAVAVDLTGNDGVTFVKQAGEVRLNEKVKIMGPNLMDELFAKAAGPSALGVQSAIRYHFTYDNPNNRKFVEAYRRKFDAYPDPFAAEAYDGMTWWLDVVDRTGSWDVEKWVAAFENNSFENSVDGAKRMRACDHQATQSGLWGLVIKGEPPLPAYTMKIEEVFPPETIFPPCG
jgi:ABC-type branched-subunit amino acid transport system substrate-binding protein